MAFTIRDRESSLLSREAGSLTKDRIEDLLTDTQALRGDLEKLIGIDVVDALLERHNLLRNELQCFIRRGCTGVGQMLRLADIDLDILGLRRLADDHAAINLLASPMKRVPLACAWKRP